MHALQRHLNMHLSKPLNTTGILMQHERKPCCAAPFREMKPLLTAPDQTASNGFHPIIRLNFSCVTTPIALNPTA